MSKDTYTEHLKPSLIGFRKGEGRINEYADFKIGDIVWVRYNDEYMEFTRMEYSKFYKFEFPRWEILLEVPEWVKTEMLLHA